MYKPSSGCGLNCGRNVQKSRRTTEMRRCKLNDKLSMVYLVMALSAAGGYARMSADPAGDSDGKGRNL
jgi:hypothetical protein